MKVKSVTKKAEKGFTLIELLVVIAIMSILFLVSIPPYQTYVAKSQTTAALTEISQGRVGFEDNLNENRVSDTPQSIGLYQNFCDKISVSTGADGGISCEFKLRGETKTMLLDRDASTGKWTCTSTADKAILPKACQPNQSK